MKRLVSLILVPFFILFSVTVISQERQGQANTFKTDKGYGYEFDDDPLAAGGFGPNDSIIKVRPRAARVTLIRPRTSFVYEMFKSVEDI